MDANLPTQMKIACIGTGWYPQVAGGLEKYLYGLMQALLRAGDSVDLFVTGEPQYEAPRAQVYSIGKAGGPLIKRMLDARLAFARYFREPYDVINIHFAMNALPLIPFIDHRTLRVMNFQGPWGAEDRAEGGSELSARIKEALERFVYRRADRFIVLSSAFKEILTGYGVEADRISVIPIGIDCNFFRPAADRRAVRDALGWPADMKIFFTARRLVHRVGLFELLKAALILRASQANFKIKIAGRGPLRALLEQEINALGLGDCVELMGFVSEDTLAQCYQGADITIVPTQALEGFGTIISESLASGTPVVVTPVGGMPEVVSPLGAGLISRSPAPADIAERMGAVLDGTLALPDAETCRRYAVENFDWPRVCERVRAVFSMNISSTEGEAPSR
jgi:glycosyltransferase involved in cell wall biosynthesis